MSRPELNECAPFYHGYINELPSGDLFDILENQRKELVDTLKELSEERALYRYADSKWSIKEIIGHLIDAERVFTFRAMAFARNDPGPYPGMDENDYVKYGNFDNRNLNDLLEEHGHVRAATLSFFKSIDSEIGLRQGTASECKFTVRSLMAIIAGHERHHLKVLKERYL